MQIPQQIVEAVEPPKTAVEQKAVEEPIAIGGGSSIFNLSAALNTEYNPQQEEEATKEADTEANREQSAENGAESSAEQTIIENKEKIVTFIHHSRARYVPFFQAMRVVKNVVIVDVPTEDIAKDIERLWADNRADIAEEVGVEGRVEIEVNISAEIKIARPIKLEDRVIHIVTKEPMIEVLVDKLGLILE